MKCLLITLLIWSSSVMADCYVVQVSPTHRDVSCTGNAAVRNPQPTTITTYTMVPYEPAETQQGYYPTRVTGTVAGGQYVPPKQTYGWGAGGAGRQYYGGTR